MSDHPINGWTFKIEWDTKRPLSRVYREIKHSDHNFATEIAIEKIIVEVEKDGKSISLSLDSSQLEALSGEEMYELLPSQDMTGGQGTDLANFSIYPAAGFMRVLKTKKNVLPPNDVQGKPVDEPLYLIVSSLFGVYDNDPPHEFTGGLLAARFTPAFRFQTRNDHVGSIRVDYRFHFDLDSYLQSASPLTKAKAELKKQMQGKENYALVIRDADHFPRSLMGVFGLLKEVSELYEGLKFFSARLDECKYEGTCRSEASKLKLKLSNAGNDALDKLNISFRDPRRTLADASKALDKTSTSVKDENVVAVSVAGPAEYNQKLVDELAKKIFRAVVGSTKPAKGIKTYPGLPLIAAADQPLPGVSSECLLSYIKHSLVQLAGERYVLREGAVIVNQVEPLLATMKSDLKDVLQYLEWDDVKQVFEDIVDLIKSRLMEPLAPFLGRVVTLEKFAKLVEHMQPLIGKLMSIVSFDGVEKPVLYELVGTFVNEGDVTGTWDNMHWWGTEKIPSAPGAFHAAHTHFRWSQLNTYPSPEEEQVLDVLNSFGTKKALFNKTPQLRSLVKTFVEKQLSGPLIDPNIPKQTIHFALALNGGTLDKKLKEKPKENEPVETFDKVDVTPMPIASVSESGNKGADIVYWLSCKAQRTDAEVFKGTLLVNGFYFAHDEEKPLGLFLPGNMFGPSAGVDLQKPIREKPYKLFRGPFY